ncbi:MAG: hypothetical protein PHF00_09875, partial [Elusimicrobia bacterium]|nr:hypothetical protein [Elusimicrobiota bacterium]
MGSVLELETAARGLGTDGFYDGLAQCLGRALGDNHELLSSEGDSYMIKNTPKDADQVEFSYYQVQ